MSKVYIITANTFLRAYGAEIEIFGAFDSLEKANAAKEELESKYEYKFKIDKLTLNELTQIYLGGYFE